MVKRIFLLFVLVSLSKQHFAGVIGWSNKLTGTAISNGATIEVKDDRYDYMVANPSAWPNEFWNQGVKNKLRLRFADTAVANNYRWGNWTLSVPVTLQKWNAAGASLPSSSYTLTLDVKPGQSTLSQDLNVVEELSNQGYRTLVTVGTPSVTGTSSTVPADVLLESEIETERYYKFDQTSVPGVPSHQLNTTDNTITFYWPQINWAEAYELEWMLASVYDPSSQTSLDWSRAVRISTAVPFYTIQNIFDQGKVYCRLRWVSRVIVGSEVREMESGWSVVNPSTNGITISAAFNSDKHWAYSESFAEEGKRGEALGFMDDLGRTRQTQGLVKSENKLLISEPFYDYEGRAVLQTMAAPTADFSGKFEFKDGFTKISGANTSLRPKDYDKDYLNGNCVSGMDVQLSTQQGASRYYSSANGLINEGMYALLPDAGKYPYAHVRFNAQGDVASVSGTGIDHALGSGHETKVYYSTVPQEKLFELFGSGVGYAEHYRSKYVMDANGQLSGSYEDMSGKVIATFLTGDKPTNLEGIAEYNALSNPPVSLMIDLMGHDDFNPSLPGYELYQDIMVTQKGVSYDFTYGVTPQGYTGICGGTHACHYILNLAFYRVDCPDAAPIATYSANVSSVLSTYTLSVTFPEIGQYKVKKTLVLDETYLTTALNSFIAAYDGCKPFDAPDVPDLDCSGECPGGEDCSDTDGNSPTNQSVCDDLKERMKDDLSPGGQYYVNDGWMATLSSTDYSNIQAFANGTTVGGITSTCAPTATVTISNFAQLRTNWNDCLRDFMLTLHPEKCHLQWCYYEDDLCGTESSRMFEARIRSYDYNAANTAFSFGTSDPGDVIFDADPYFHCSNHGNVTSNATMYNAMDALVNTSPNSMWVQAGIDAGCPTTPCDAQWFLFLNRYTAAKNQVINTEKTASCGYLTDDTDPFAMNGLNETSNGNFIIHVPNPAAWSGLSSTTPVPYTPNVNVCGGSTCTSFDFICSSYSLTPGGHINIAYTGSGTTSYNYTIATYTGSSSVSMNGTAFASWLVAQINAYAPPLPIGIYPAITATQNGSQVTICLLPPNDLNNGTVNFNFSGISGMGGCSFSGTLSFTYVPPSATTNVNDCITPPNCFCAELQNLENAWNATIIDDTDPANPVTIDVVDGTHYMGGITEYMAEQLNIIHGTTVASSVVAVWYANCSTYAQPIHTISDPALGALDCNEDPDNCEEEAYAVIYQNEWAAYQQQKEKDIQDFIAGYRAACFGGGFNQTFTGSFKSNEYHYTLYYYDQADNLVRTVSPKAVKKIVLDYTATTGNRAKMLAYLANGTNPVYPDHAYYYLSGATLPNGTSSPSPNINLVTTYKYNSLDQPTSTTSPDATGATVFYYDRLARLVASQNPKQAAYSPKRYSYTFFDALGRITEVGEVATSSTVTPTGTVVASDANFQSWVTASGNTRYEVTQSYYDELTNQPYTYTVNGFNQNGNYQRNRVNAITYEKVYNALSNAYDAASYYQYDVHGNAERVLKDVSELASLGQNLKQTLYDYELISGNVNKVIYQPGQADQFIHTYDYDADNRLVHTLTSHQGLIYHQDEKQFYYLHGPTARTEIGEHKVQGQDYIYTIHGWLKGVNASVLDRRKDAGKDGRRESLYLNGECTIEQYSPNDAGKDLHSRIGADAFGFALSYYNTPAGQGNPGNRDYISIKGNLDPEPDNYFTTGSTLNLYNGNIKQMSVALMKGNSMTGVNTGTVTPNMPYAGVKMELLQWQYTYDQLQRLTNATAFTGTSSSTYTGHNDNNEYKNTFSYDANGNILTQLRNGNAATLNLDNLTYNYQNNATTGGATNQLQSVTENLAQSNNTNYTDDYDNISRNKNCTYDEIGQLKTDQRHFITEIKWNVYGKVTEVLKDKSVKFDDYNNNNTQDVGEPAVTLSDIEYRYNEMGQRIVKIVKPHHATNTALEDQRVWKYTYYSYDAGGNVMAVYNRDYTAPAGTPQRYDDVLELAEHHIYGSGRVGMATYKDKEVAKTTYTYTATVNNIYQGTPYSSGSYSLTLASEKRTLGMRLYEMVNHLQNVLVTVSDKKIPVFESVTVCTTAVTYNNTFTHYTADVQSATDYSPFGAPLTGRSFSSNIYRYGMNGQEKENELLGDGNAMSAEFWMYDARLGRRWNVDPLGYENQSPYSTFNNNPLYFSDPYGLEGNPVNGELQTRGKTVTITSEMFDEFTEQDMFNNLEDWYWSKNSPQGYPPNLASNNSKATTVPLNRHHEFEFRMSGTAQPSQTTPSQTSTSTSGGGRDISGAPWETQVEEYFMHLFDDNISQNTDQSFAEDAKPVAEFVADMNPLMAGGHIINGLLNDNKDAYGNEMNGWDYGFHTLTCATPFIPWGKLGKLAGLGGLGAKGSKVMRTIVESAEATKVYDKLAPSLRQKVDDAIKLLFEGKAGGNQHALSKELQGFNAIDIKASGKGRGGLRVVYKMTDDEIYIHQIIDYHK